MKVISNRAKLIELIGDIDDVLNCVCSLECVDCKYEKSNKCATEILVDHILTNSDIIPPCSVGDIVYTNYDHLLHKEVDKLFVCKVVFIGLCKDGNYINVIDNYEHLHSMSFETFNKTMSYNREEVEKRIKLK